jgi:hypothetical protein
MGSAFLAESAAVSQPLLTRETAPQTQFLIERAEISQQPRLRLRGLPGQTYSIDAISDFASARWDPWLAVVSDGQPMSWSEVAMLDIPFQFFRVRAVEPDALQDVTSSFRLLDHQGVARDLHYHTHLAAIAVLAAGSNLEQVVPWLPMLGELAQTHADNFLVWILLSDPAAIRSNVLAQARSLAINFPVLLDPDGLAARSVGLKRAGEVALIKPPEFVVAYRGRVADTTQSSAAQSYLGSALDALLTDRIPTFLRTPVNAPLLAHVETATPDYPHDIAPIFHQYCATCHRPDSVAPFALTNYSVVESWAPVIKQALLSGKMPPWHADPEYGNFTNNLSLPSHLRAALVQWIDAGAPRGDGGDPLEELALPAAYTGWPESLGEPDALVTIPVQDIKAEGAEAYRYIYTRAPNPSNVWLRAAIVRPSNYRAVHHYLVWLGRIGNSGMPDSSSYEPYIAEFVPGYQPRPYPTDAGILLTNSNWLTFNLHYTPTGTASNDQPVLALWYHKTKPPKLWSTAGIANGDFVIPPGNRDYPVQASWTPPTAITLQRLNPHMHVRGKRIKYEVFYPNGTREVLLSVPDYDFSWQIGYQFAEPKFLPKGSRLVVSGAFDNSPQNVSNPDPTASVRWGDQSWMEMFVGFIDYTH